MILVRPVIRVILNAASLASVPELVKNTRASAPPVIAVSRPASATWAGVAKKLETWPRVAIWPVMADSTVGWAWPEPVDRQPGQQIEVLATVGVPDVAALAADEDPLGRAEGVHHRVRVRLEHRRRRRGGQAAELAAESHGVGGHDSPSAVIGATTELAVGVLVRRDALVARGTPGCPAGSGRPG